MKRYLFPLAAFLLLTGFLAAGLGLKPRELPSPLVDRPAPAFDLPTLASEQRRMTPNDLRGRVWLLNVWASWCTACRDEHAAMVELAKSGTVPIYGLNYKDRPDEARGWLQRFGNPYVASLSDVDGRVGIDYGVYGVPETFVIDRDGVIRGKLVGPLTAESYRDVLQPLLRRLGA